LQLNENALQLKYLLKCNLPNFRALLHPLQLPNVPTTKIYFTVIPIETDMSCTF